MSGRLAVMDPTHVETNASRTSEQQMKMLESPETYWERLDNCEEEGLKTLKMGQASEGRNGPAGQTPRPGTCHPQLSVLEQWGALSTVPPCLATP